MSDLELLQSRLGARFRDPALLRLALTHPSVAHEQGGPAAHNQRLEFLGDAVLGLVLTSELYQRFPALGEGVLTKARARLVNRRFLAELARRLDLGSHLVLSRGEESSGGRGRASILADSLEAVVGALFLDSGLEHAREFILGLFEPELAVPPPDTDTENPKGQIQERLQAASLPPPRYEIEKTTGPDHDRRFHCLVIHNDAVLGRGEGRSKKEAEANAALDALRRLPVPPPPPADPSGGAKDHPARGPGVDRGTA